MSKIALKKKKKKRKEKHFEDKYTYFVSSQKHMSWVLIEALLLVTHNILLLFLFFLWRNKICFLQKEAYLNIWLILYIGVLR